MNSVLKMQLLEFRIRLWKVLMEEKDSSHEVAIRSSEPFAGNFMLLAVNVSAIERFQIVEVKFSLFSLECTFSSFLLCIAPY